MSERQAYSERDDAPLSTSKESDAADEAVAMVPGAQGSTLVARTVTINAPREKLFAYWRDFANLPSFMENIERIDIIDVRRSHWVVKGPNDSHYEWDATVTDERPGSMIAWASAEGSDIHNSGRVDFMDAPGGRGTWVTATILYDPPGGVIGKAVAKLFRREPAVQAKRELRRFKQLMETGEIATAARTRAAARAEME